MVDTNAADVVRTQEAILRDRLRETVRQQPLVSVAVAGAVGAMLGGVIFSRLGRLVFVAAAGYVANELWHREGRLDIDDVIDKLSR